MSGIETPEGRYHALLSHDQDPEVRERYRKEAAFLAFYQHLGALGRQQDIGPDLKDGDTRISIPAYFALEGFRGNPVNEEALQLLPRYSYTPGYGDTTDVHADKSGLRKIIALPDDELKAARNGESVRFVVAKTLGLLDPALEDVYGEWSTAYHIRQAGLRPIHEISGLVNLVSEDLDDKVVGNVHDVATMAKQSGYTDFLDYLVDARHILSGRVDSIFENEPQAVPQA